MSFKTQSGGMFNSYKINYCPETHRLLKVLMEEVKLTTAQRQQMKECLKRGQPLPAIPRRYPRRPSYVDDNLFDLKRNYYFMRRGLDQIIHSGAYERDRYKFLGRTVDLEKEKEKLQNIMFHGKNLKKNSTEQTPVRITKRMPKMITAEERIEEIINEIKERIEFLKEMEVVGKAKNYEAIMKQEIAAKLRELERLDKDIAEKYIKVLEPLRTSKTKIGQDLNS